MDHHYSGSSSSDEEDATKQPKDDEELVTRLQLRLSASHLPRVGRLKLTRRSPDTFATVASISSKGGTRASIINRNTQDTLSASFYPESTLKSDDDYMVKWGTTEVIRNTTSPQWIQTIPLQYEYGSECFFYVRIHQAGGSEKSPKGKDNQRRSLSPMSKGNGATESGIFHESPEKDRSGHCFGTALFEVGDILGSRNYTKVKRLKGGGCVYAHVEPLQNHDEERLQFRFQFQALNLDVKRSTLSKQWSLGTESTTLLEIARPHESPTIHSWITVFRSRPVIHSNNPCWDLAEINLESCCRNDDLSGVIRLSVYRVKKGNKQSLVGLCETTMHNILANAQTEEIGAGVLSEKDFLLQKNMRTIQQVGQLRVKVACMVTQSGRLHSGSLPPSSPVNTQSPRNSSSPASIARTDSQDSTITNGEDPFNVDLRQLSVRFSATQPMEAITLNDFIDSGGQMDFAVAIDFTSSNGNPLQPGTLHFQSDVVLNDYEESITSIANAVDKYNASSDYCVWGFGAKFGAPNSAVQHLFQCGQQPTIKGVEGILDAYRSVFRSGGIYMSGPTVFVKAIQAAAVRARKFKMAGANTYTILLIVTDGIMDNFEETKQKLSFYSEVPLSVVIVGVGRHDFQSMHALCNAPHPANPHARKNTKFVEFRRHQHDPRSLAPAALGEIPKQLSQYMIQNGIRLPKASR